MVTIFLGMGSGLNRYFAHEVSNDVTLTCWESPHKAGREKSMLKFSTSLIGMAQRSRC